MDRRITYPPLSPDEYQEYYEEYATEQLESFLDNPEDVPSYIYDQDDTDIITDPDKISIDNILRNEIIDITEDALEKTSTHVDEPPAQSTLGPRPPIKAEFILYCFLKPDERDTFIGDLLEQYAKVHERLGERLARRWFWWEVGRSLWPLIKRAFLKTSGLLAIGEWIRKHIS
jgi:hypothetical protein